MRAAVSLLLVVSLASPAFADRTQVFSIQGAECSDCGKQIERGLKKVKGVKKAKFDKRKVELTVKLRDGVADTDVIKVVEELGFKAVAGSGQGAYRPFEPFPAAADVRTLSADGSAVGPLEKLRVPDKYTVFDVYADWCGPCRFVDARLREISEARKDVAVRKLNVVDFDSALARELGPDFSALPYLIVFSPAGKRTEIVGANFPKLDRALGPE